MEKESPVKIFLIDAMLKSVLVALLILLALSLATGSILAVAFFGLIAALLLCSRFLPEDPRTYGALLLLGQMTPVVKSPGWTLRIKQVYDLIEIECVPQIHRWTFDGLPCLLPIPEDLGGKPFITKNN